MKKVIFIQFLMLVVLGGLIFFLCYDEKTIDIPLEKLETALSEELSVAELEKVSDMKLKKNLGINAADFSEYIYYAPSNTMAVDELLVIKLMDEGAKDAVISGIQKRLDSQKKAFDGYGVGQTEILNDAIIYDKGNYVCFLSSKNSDKWLEIINKLIKE